MPKLYDAELSGSCYKIRLLSSFLDLALDKQPVDFLAKEHKTAPYTALNPFGELPIFEDGGVVLRDAQAILTYVAGQYDPARTWWPDDAKSQGLVAQWLSTGGNEVMSAAGARLVKVLKYDLDLAKLQARAKATFTIMDAHLEGRDWLELGHPTIGDIACFPYTALSGEGGISLAPYKNILAWITRIKALPRYIPMPGL